MATQTNTGKTPRGLCPRPPETHQTAAVQCCRCVHFETPARDRVGWCRVQFQYRAADIERQCDTFSDNGG